MQVSVFITLVLSSVARFGTCLRDLHQNNAEVNSSDYGIFDDEERMYYETTLIPGWTDSDSSSGDGVKHSHASELLIPKPIVTGPVFDNSSSDSNGSTVQELMEVERQKRDTRTRGLSSELKQLFLQMHNVYRGKVIPPSGNMEYMEWDDELARLAQIWSDNCTFGHHVPEFEKHQKMIGQNIYEGVDRTGMQGLHMWFQEHIYYDLRKIECEPGEECGHFVQMAWPASNKLGCAMSKCGKAKHMFVCHYLPQAISQTQMYEVAKSCSSCSRVEGSLCINNLCISPEQCKNNPFDCQCAKCELECHNCGSLNKDTCTCECMDGWDANDCSLPCVNKHYLCGRNPGWPTSAACSMNSHIVGNKFCRKMCGKCFNVDNTTLSNRTCCDGKVCDFGFVLNKDCECKLLCPGPICDSEEVGLYESAEHDVSEAVMGNSAKKVVVIPPVAYWIIVLSLCHVLRNL